MRAYIALGVLYLRRRRYAEARATFEAAAANNFVPAIHRLGRMYFCGEGVDKDFAKARSLLERASGCGNIAAKLLLAHLLRTGHFGLRQAIRARWLGLTGSFECMSVYMKEPQSERLL